MKTKTRSVRMAFVIVAILLPAAFAEMGAAAGPAVRITMADGSHRVARIDGVGCTLSICSRTGIEGRDENQALIKTPFDSIASIRDTTANDALFVMKDGSRRRLSLVKDFRVLYLGSAPGHAERLDLSRVRSVEFTPDLRNPPVSGRP